MKPSELYWPSSAGPPPVGPPSIQDFSSFEIGLDTHSLSFPNPITLGDALVVCIGANAAIDPPTDAGGNVYVLAAQADNGIGIHIAAYYSLTGNEPGLVTATATGGSFVNVLLVEYPPCTALRDAQGGQFNVGPVELTLAMLAGDIVLGFAKALDSSAVTGGEVNGVAADLLDADLPDLVGFDAFANASGSLLVRAFMSNEGSVFGALVALSLVPA